MEKYFLLLYQFYILKNYSRPYASAILTYVFIIALHLFLLQEILVKSKLFKFDYFFYHINLCLSLVIFFCVILVFILSLVFKRVKLKKYNFEKRELNSSIIKILIYCIILIISIVMLQ
jgi:hypothetical protein